MKNLVLVLLLACAITVANSKPIKGKLKDNGDYATCRGSSGVCGFTGLPIAAQVAMDKHVFFFPKDYLGTMPSNAYFNQEKGLYRVDDVRIEQYPRWVSTEEGGEPEPCTIIYY